MVGIGVEIGREEGMTGTAIATGVDTRVKPSHDRTPPELQSAVPYADKAGLRSTPSRFDNRQLPICDNLANYSKPLTPKYHSSKGFTNVTG